MPIWAPEDGVLEIVDARCRCVRGVRIGDQGLGRHVVRGAEVDDFLAILGDRVLLEVEVPRLGPRSDGLVESDAGPYDVIVREVRAPTRWRRPAPIRIRARLGSSKSPSGVPTHGGKAGSPVATVRTPSVTRFSSSKSHDSEAAVSPSPSPQAAASIAKASSRTRNLAHVDVRILPPSRSDRSSLATPRLAQGSQSPTGPVPAPT